MSKKNQMFFNKTCLGTVMTQHNYKIFGETNQVNQMIGFKVIAKTLSFQSHF